MNKTVLSSPRIHRIAVRQPRRFATYATALIVIGLALAACTRLEILTQHNDSQRTGANLLETFLTTSNVQEETFGFLWQDAVDGQMYAQPLYLQGAPITNSDGSTINKNVVYVATMHNVILAFDADAPGPPLWRYDAGSFQQNVFGRPVPTKDAYGNKPEVFNISPVIGIVSTPVIDKATNTLYAVAMTEQDNRIVHRLHAVDVVTGKAKNGVAPVVIDGGAGFSSRHQLQRAALALANDRVYLAWASFADQSSYDGFIMSYGTIGSAKPLAKLEQFQVVVNNSGRQGGIWQSGGGPAIDPEGFLYVVTGNGQNSNENSGVDFDESDVKLNAQLTGPVNGRVVDFYTPSYQNFLNEHDLDLGVGGPMVLPPQLGPAQKEHIAGCPKPGRSINLLAHGSKAGLLYLINRDCMGGFDEHDNHTPAPVRACPGQCDGDNPDGCSDMHIHSTPVFWDSADGPRVYAMCELMDTDGGLTAFTIKGGEWVQKPVAKRNLVNGQQMSLSANGKQRGSGVLWTIMPSAQPDEWVTQVVDGMLLAFDAETLRLLWTSESPHRLEDRLGKYPKFAAPTIANGKVYVGTFSNCDQPSPGPCPSERFEGNAFLKVYGLRVSRQHIVAPPHLFIAWRGVPGDEGVYWSNFDGVRWAPQQKIESFGNSQRPALAVFQERLQMAWKGVGGDDGIYWSSSEGMNWLGQLKVPDVGTSVGSALASFNNKLFMTWKGVGGDAGIYESSFDGQQWAPQQKIPGVGTTAEPALTVLNGALVMAWKGVSGDSGIYTSSSDVTGQHWASQQKVSNVGTSDGPALATLSGTLFMAWKGVSGDSGIYFSSSIDGRHWAPQQKIPNVGTSGGPALAVLNGTLFMAWKGVSGDSGIYFSTLVGKTWAPQQKISGVGTAIGPALAAFP